MGGMVLQRRTQRFLPLRRPLTGKSIDQVEAQILKPCVPRIQNRLMGLPPVVNAAQEPEIFLAERLDPQTQPVDSQPAIPPELLDIHRPRIRLQRDLCIRDDREHRMDRLQNPLELRNREQRGCSPSEKKSLNPLAASKTPARGDLPDQSRKEILPRRSRLERIEIAVETLL